MSHPRQEWLIQEGKYVVLLALLGSQILYNGRNVAQPALVEGVENKFPVPLGQYYASFAQDGQVLAGYTLLQPEFHVDFSNGQALALIEQVDHALPQFVVYGAQYQCCFAEFNVVEEDVILPIF